MKFASLVECRLLGRTPTTKYQVPTPYGLRDIARARFYRSRSIQQGQIKVTP